MGGNGTVDRDPEVLDSTQALSRVGGDLAILLEIVGIIHAAWPALICDIEGAVAARNLGAVKRTTHLAKIAADNVSASRTYQCALCVNGLAEHGEWHAAMEACGRLKHEVSQLEPALAELEDALWFLQS